MKHLQKRALGIDYGLARIGISISDESKTIVSPWATISAEKKLEETILKLIQEIRKIETEKHCQIDEIIVGMPKHMNGTVGFLADEVHLFIQQLKSKLENIHILPWDERLTSVQADRTLRESNMTRKKRSKSVDSVAAMILLQSYLEYKSLGLSSM